MPSNYIRDEPLFIFTFNLLKNIRRINEIKNLKNKQKSNKNQMKIK